MEEDIHKIMTKDKDSYESALKLRNSFNELETKMRNNFFGMVQEKNKSLYKKDLQYGGFNFTFHQSEDGDGFFVGVFVTKDGVLGIINQHPILQKLRTELKASYGETVSNHNYIGWITPLGHKMRYDSLSPELKFELFTNQLSMEDKLNEIFQKSKVFLTKAEQLIKTIE